MSVTETSTERGLLGRVVCPRCGAKGEVLRDSWYNLHIVSQLTSLDNDAEYDVQVLFESVGECEQELFSCARCRYEFGSYPESLLEHML